MKLNVDGDMIPSLESTYWSTPECPVPENHSSREARAVFATLMPEGATGYFPTKDKKPVEDRWDPAPFLQEPKGGDKENPGRWYLFEDGKWEDGTNYTYAVYITPGSNICVFDLDPPRDLTGNPDMKYRVVEKMRDRFSMMLETDLSETTTVRTPSGGMHLTVELPKRFTPSPNTSTHRAPGKGFPIKTLAKYNRHFEKITGINPRLNGDIRSAHSKGYVNGPTRLWDWENPARNYTAGKNAYFLMNRKKPLKLSVKACQILRDGAYLEYKQASKRDRKKRAEAEKRRNAKHEQGNGNQRPLGYWLNKHLDNTKHLEADYKNLFSDDSYASTLLNEAPGVEVLDILAKQITQFYEDEDTLETFHGWRSIITQSMACHYSNKQIMGACIALRADRDTHRGSRISTKELRQDIRKVLWKAKKREGGIFHGPACPENILRNTKMASKPNPQDHIDATSDKGKKELDAFLKYRRDKILEGTWGRRGAGFTSFYNPRVIDMVKASDALMSPRGGMFTQKYRDAMGILDAIAQPLCNVGDHMFPMAYNFTAGMLKLDGPNAHDRVKEALRYLRDQKVLKVTNKQYEGLAATYTVADEFINDTLTRALKSSWRNQLPDANNEREPLFFDRRSGEFRQVFTGAIVTSKFNYSKEVQEIINCVNLDYTDPSLVGPATAIRYLKDERMTRGVMLAEDNITLYNEATGEVVEQAPCVTTHGAAAQVMGVAWARPIDFVSDLEQIWADCPAPEEIAYDEFNDPDHALEVDERWHPDTMKPDPVADSAPARFIGPPGTPYISPSNDGWTKGGVDIVCYNGYGSVNKDNNKDKQALHYHHMTEEIECLRSGSRVSAMAGAPL